MRHELPRASVEITVDARKVMPNPAPQPGQASAPDVGSNGHSWINPVQEYWMDACQRWIHTLDVLRRRGNSYLEQRERISPAVLNFPFEVLLDGRTFERPVNYVLVRIKSPAGVAIDPRKRPFVVFDPRAGQGPGIGGMKHDSEIGQILQAGHPCYFVGFLENPMPGQTVEDVCRAEARFVAKVGELHPESRRYPCNAERKDAAGRQLDGQRNPVELAADLRHRRCIAVGELVSGGTGRCALDEKLNGRKGNSLGSRQLVKLRSRFQGRQTLQGFALRAQWLPAGRQKVHLWRALEGLLRQFRGFLSDMFAVVDHQQHLSASQEGGKRGIRIL